MTCMKTAAAAGAGLVVMLAGCAGNQPVPAAAIDQAQQRIEEAERAEAQRYANRELNMAREKLLQAREAQQEGDEERAARYAELAELDAAYAAAAADNESAQEAVQELRETLATLESELERQQRDGFSSPSESRSDTPQPDGLRPRDDEPGDGPSRASPQGL